MNFIRSFFDTDEEFEARLAEERLRQEEERLHYIRQAQVQQAAVAQQQIFQGFSQSSGTSQASSGVSMESSYISSPQLDSWLNQAYHRWEPSPSQHAEDLIDSLHNVNSFFIKELVIHEDIYNELLIYMGIDVKTNEEAKKQMQYHLPYGPLLIKNEKYQFDLDKYMEDAPGKL